jgi:hypothetical protein
MKYLMLIILFAPVITFGQFSSGDKFIGGTLSLDIGRAPESPLIYTDKSTAISFQPKVGFLFNSSLAIGGILGYSRSKIEDTSPISSFSFESKTYSFGLFIEKYISITDNFLFSIEGDIMYRKYYYSNSSNDEREINSLLVLGKPIFTFFPSKRWGIEAGFGYLGFSHKKDIINDENENVLNIDYGGLNLGLSYYLR